MSDTQKANILITVFKNVLDKRGTPIELLYALNQIKNGEREAQIEQLRTLKGEAYKKAKRQLPVHNFTGQFVGGQGIVNLETPSGLMVLDFDGYGTPEDMQADRLIFQSDKYCLACWVSPSGKGLKILVRIPATTDNDIYKNYANAFKAYSNNPHFDDNAKDIARACFVSYDPELFTNWDALIWDKKAENVKELQTPQAPQQICETVTDSSKIFETLLKAEGANVNLSTGHWNSGVHFLAARCNDYGIPQHEAEGLIWDYADRDGTGYKDALKTIRSAYSQPSANKTYNVPQNQHKPIKRTKTDIKKAETVTADLFNKKDGIVYNLVSERQVYRNLLTGKIEFNTGQELTDSDINTIALQASSIYGKDIGTDSILRMLFSDYTPHFHPFDDYIRQLSIRPLKTGVMDAFLNCLKLEKDHNPEYLQKVVKKWFGGLMGTLCGNYSVMTLVFVGKQGNGKTSFFRNLLPNTLKKYFAESEITQDKDCMARMCQNFIVYSDEFTSKNKTEASAYKMMSSADKFTYRKPYGKIDETRKRTAVLCGSANEGDILSDPTGNRRIIPVRLKNIDHKALSNIDINDFYRELLELHKSNPEWWYLSPEDIALLNADTVQNEAVDEFAERVAKWTESDENGLITTTDVSKHIAERDISYRANVHKLGRALTNAYGGSVQMWDKGKNIRGYKIRLVENSERNQGMPF